MLTAIDDEGDNVEDAFQATICLGWLHFELGEPGLAVARFPKDFAAVASKMSSNEGMNNWTLVCLVKGAYLKGADGETATGLHTLRLTVIRHFSGEDRNSRRGSSNLPLNSTLVIVVEGGEHYTAVQSVV